MTTRRFLAFFSSLTLLITLFSRPLMSQITTGTISGTVSDQSGAAVPGATVIAKNVETGVSRTTVSGPTGRYEVPTLPAGSYEVSSSMPGFQTLVRSGIELTVGRNAVVNLALQVGEVSQAVTVTGEVALVETTTATVSNLVSEREVADLPLNNRDLNQLALLQPGVLRSRETGSNSDGLGTKLVVSGARGNQNLYLLDGVSSADYIGSASNATGAYTGAETVKEFQIITNNYSAEYQSAAGAIVSAVTKSGTNSFHGSLFEFYRNENLDAYRWEDNRVVGTSPRKPAFLRNQFGGSLGGPVIRDRTFFFGSYEGLREETERSSVANVLSASARQGILNVPGGVSANTCTSAAIRGTLSSDGRTCTINIAPQVRPYLSLWPVVGQEGTALLQENPDGTVQVSGLATRPIEDDFFAVKMDHRLGGEKAGFLSGTYNFDDGFDAQFDVLRATNGGVRDVTRKNILSMQHSSVLSPTLVNLFKFGFARNRITGQQPTERPEFPNLEFIPGRALLGRLTVTGLTNVGNSESEQGVTQTTSHFSESLLMTRGSHSFKFGAEVTRYWNFMRHYNRGYYGEYIFPDLPRFFTAAPQTFQAGFPGRDDPDRNVNQYFWGGYVQDNWSVARNLTLNLGLRYEYTTDPVEVDGKMAALVRFTDARQTRGLLVTNPTAKSFSPRFGFAWVPIERTSVRGGFGIFYDSPILMKNLRSGLTVLEGVAEFGLVQDTVANAQGTPLVFPNAYAAQPQLLASNPAYTGFQYDVPNTSSYRWSLTLQRELGSAMVVSAGYTGARGLHLWTQMNANLNKWEGFPNNPTGAKFFPAITGTNRINPNYSEMRYQSPQGNSYYHGLEVSARNRISRGLHYQVAYTFSKNIDQGATLTGGGLGQQQRQIYFWDMYKRKALSANDIRHSLISSFSYDLPFGSQLTGVAGALIKGWQVNGIITLAGGNPLGVWDVNNAQLARFAERVDGLTLNLIPGGDSNPTSGTTAGCTVGNAARSVVIPAGAELGGPDLYYDPCQFQPSTLGFFGTLGGNTLIGPGLAMADLSLAKDFAVTEGQQVQFRAEFFNALNTPQFNNPLATPYDNQLRNNVGVLNQITSTRPNLTARQIQFGVKYVF